MVATTGPITGFNNCVLCNNPFFGRNLFRANRGLRRHRPAATTGPCRLRTRVTLFLSGLALSFLALHVSMFLMAGPEGEDSVNAAAVAALRSPRRKPHTSLDAIVTVAMCGYDARDMVRSLRSAGEWTGPIYVLTDSPDGEDPSQCTPVDVRGDHPTFPGRPDEYDDYRRALGRWNALYSKWHKTQIFRLLPDKEVRTVLFMDADMVAQRSLVGSSWLDEVEPLITDPSCELVTYPERWYTTVPLLGGKNRTVTGRYHSGFMILKRDESARLLEAWSSLMVHPEFMDRDQGKLTQAVDLLRTRVCWQPSRWRHMQIGADGIDGLWFRLTTKGTFYHVASSKSKLKTNKRKGVGGSSSSATTTSWGDKYGLSCNYTWPNEETSD
jgi:hypothetical protein